MSFLVVESILEPGLEQKSTLDCAGSSKRSSDSDHWNRRREIKIKRIELIKI